MQNLILVGSIDSLCLKSLLPITTTDKDKPDAKSKKVLIDRVCAMHIICYSAFKQHRMLVTNIRKAQDLGRKE
eukprot:8048580-Ditylum_brightwellii.AAC.1